LPTVHVPPPYRGPTRGASELEVTGATVGECLDAVEELHPGFRTQVLDDEGRLHRFVKLFVNGEQLGEGALSARLEPDDQLEVLAAIAGGRGDAVQSERVAVSSGFRRRSRPERARR
jgi:molybdopterin synthase sulfur carrier subunit